jgi:hypothetical protein
MSPHPHVKPLVPTHGGEIRCMGGHAPSKPPTRTQVHCTEELGALQNLCWMAVPPPPWGGLPRKEILIW